MFFGPINGVIKFIWSSGHSDGNKTSRKFSHPKYFTSEEFPIYSILTGLIKCLSMMKMCMFMQGWRNRSGNCPTNISAYFSIIHFIYYYHTPKIIKFILHMWAGKSLQWILMRFPDQCFFTSASPDVSS